MALRELMHLAADGPFTLYFIENAQEGCWPSSFPMFWVRQCVVVKTRPAIELGKSCRYELQSSRCCYQLIWLHEDSVEPCIRLCKFFLLKIKTSNEKIQISNQSKQNGVNIVSVCDKLSNKERMARLVI